ncbi:pyruvate dehydrogenase (acetyl-transferring) E1 component subunit alpha [Haladaptatus caseinilyticus]|uniref:pyruvate dehydrogenase (acetyl-transferring) E1 component subunit alpha n=1 Tax=Haladaptatus caseinilyticus TaxID=2993314 RepID=UPI00224AD933|nr:pyruvate dehydrogenase (acetyl-transferring) E1 component subunit alpha [Haladaptatus caseinilyticus]
MPREQAIEFTIDYVQVVAPDGVVDADLEPDIPTERLLEMYRAMKFSRRLDERAIALQRRGELGTYAPAIGQEAAQVGSAAALTEADWMVPSFREQPAYLTRDTPPHMLLWYAMGMEEGAAVPRANHTMAPSVPVGSQALHAAGLGWAQEIAGEDAATLAYFGDGATSEGDVYEACNLGGVFRSHTVFLCQNNQYAISVPRANQTRAQTLAQKAIAAGIEGVQVDGNDVLGTYSVVQDALKSARDGNPVFIEAITYRRSVHTTADDPSVYRKETEEEEWATRDPIARFETYLREREILDDDRIVEIEETIETDLAGEIEQANEGLETIDPEDMFEYTFATLTPELERQRAAFRGEADDH